LADICFLGGLSEVIETIDQMSGWSGSGPSLLIIIVDPSAEFFFVIFGRLMDLFGRFSASRCFTTHFRPHFFRQRRQNSVAERSSAWY